ncbi:hypothetical protein ACG9YX_10185 [Acinetobacter nematophilus]
MKKLNIETDLNDNASPLEIEIYSLNQDMPVAASYSFRSQKHSSA